MKKNIFILIISIISLVVLYVIFPKYDFLIGTGTPYVMRCNKITGKIDYFNFMKEFNKQNPPRKPHLVLDSEPLKEFDKQHPVLDFRPIEEPKETK